MERRRERHAVHDHGLLGRRQDFQSAVRAAGSGRVVLLGILFDPGLAGVKGEFECTAWSDAEKAANPTRHGFVRVASNVPRAGHYFEYSDGTPFLWIAEAWHTWTRKGIPFERFKQVVDDRAAKGFTAGEVLFGANNGVFMLTRAYDVPDLEPFTPPNGDRLRQQPGDDALDSRLVEQPEHGQAVGPEKIRRWWRYVEQRLAAYNVIWNVAGEYNMYNYAGMGLQFWKDLGAMIRPRTPTTTPSGFTIRRRAGREERADLRSGPPARCSTTSPGWISTTASPATTNGGTSWFRRSWRRIMLACRAKPIGDHRALVRVHHG